MESGLISGLTPDPRSDYNVLNNNSWNKNVRSITFAHDIWKDFPGDIISKQGLNMVSFPDR